MGQREHRQHPGRGRGGSPEDRECGVTTASLAPGVKQQGERGRRCREGWGWEAIPRSPSGLRGWGGGREDDFFPELLFCQYSIGSAQLLPTNPLVEEEIRR